MVERLLWNALSLLKNKLGLKFRKQYPIYPYIADFACVRARLIVELDGPSHDARQVYDKKREAYLRAKGWTIIRLTNEDVRSNLESVVGIIIRKAETLFSPPPNPSRESGRGTGHVVSNIPTLELV